MTLLKNNVDNNIFEKFSGYDFKYHCDNIIAGSYLDNYIRNNNSCCIEWTFVQ